MLRIQMLMKFTNKGRRLQQENPITGIVMTKNARHQEEVTFNTQYERETLSKKLIK